MTEEDGLRVRALVIRRSVTIFEVLAALGRKVEGETTQQILCPNPQHPERRPSARVYEDSNHVHCFACGRTWDAVGLVQTVRGCGFAEAIVWLEVAFGIGTVDGLLMVEALADLQPRRDVNAQFAACEARIRSARSRLGATQYHRLWLVLDTARERWETGRLDVDDLDEVLGTLLSRVEDAACLPSSSTASDPPRSACSAPVRPGLAS